MNYLIKRKFYNLLLSKIISEKKDIRNYIIICFFFLFTIILWKYKTGKIIGKVNNIKINQFLKVYINCLIIHVILDNFIKNYKIHK